MRTIIDLAECGITDLSPELPVLQFVVPFTIHPSSVMFSFAARRSAISVNSWASETRGVAPAKSHPQGSLARQERNAEDGGSLASFGKSQLEVPSNFRHDAHAFMQAKMIPDANPLAAPEGEIRELGQVLHEFRRPAFRAKCIRLVEVSCGTVHGKLRNHQFGSSGHEH